MIDGRAQNTGWQSHAGEKGRGQHGTTGCQDPQVLTCPHRGAHTPKVGDPTKSGDFFDAADALSLSNSFNLSSIFPVAVKLTEAKQPINQTNGPYL